MGSPVAAWICRELSKLLGIDATEDVADYILSIDNPRDLEDYMCDLLDTSSPRNKRFIDELLQKWRQPARKVEASVADNIQVYQKSDDVAEYIHGSEKPSKTKKSRGKKAVTSEQDDGYDYRRKSPSVDVQPQHNATDTHNGSVSDYSVSSKGKAPKQSAGTNFSVSSKQKTPKQSADMRKKGKFLPLFSEEGQARTVAKLPGRHGCECQAAKHTLINNCLKCGRVVCQQEGSGPCLFCGALVCTKEEEEILARGSRKSEKLRQQLMETGSGFQQRPDLLPSMSAKMKAGEEKAVRHKNKLLEYDKTSTRRTQVIDDESDYFATDNTWLSQTEKEALRKREEELRSLRHASRKDCKITLDFAGRRVVEDTETVDVYSREDSVVQSVHYGKKQDTEGTEARFTQEDFGALVNPLIVQEPPKFVQPYSKAAAVMPPGGGGESAASDKKKTLRIQDKEMQEMTDEGMCLSMHQPWASLLVAGIKKHEGRTWYSPHRGRLWIAATAKKPTPQEIAECEHQHSLQYNDASLEFPESYPVGCLLGCVDVMDCLAQDQYRQQYPSGESASPYVFICETPQELLVKFTIKGKHKIYKLEHQVHQAAKRGLHRAR